MNRPRVLIAAYPFCESRDDVFDDLAQQGMDVVRNPYGRKLTVAEAADLLTCVDGVIAGVEDVYTAQVIASARRLKAICRIGSGYDNIDLAACREQGVTVTYTPLANVQSVAELTLALMLNLVRHIPRADRLLHAGRWEKPMGRLLGELTIGIIGLGRIGKQVARLLKPFGPELLAHDLDPDLPFAEQHGIYCCDRQQILERSDLLTLHVSYSRTNYHYIDRKTIGLMKQGMLLINTSRGPVVDDGALRDALQTQHIAAAALDVFEQEPYDGPLTELDNCVLTPHIGAFAKRSLSAARVEACEECIRILSGEAPCSPVPMPDQ